MRSWVSFAAIKRAVSMEVVLERYRWQGVQRRGHHVQGPCPIHQGQRRDAFHADLQRHIFHCFCCQQGGGVLELVAGLEGCSIRQAGLLLQEWFGAPKIGLACDAECQPAPRREGERMVTPLRFTLQPIDGAHPYLKQRGIQPDTAAHFGVGYYAGPGLMQGRVVIPIHDEQGRLLAYAGRSLDGGAPKYKLPTGFRKATVLFNLDRAAACRQDSVIVVEGFFDCLKVHQAGHRSVIGLMGCCLSPRQEDLLMERFGRVVLLLDADPAGWRASQQIASRLTRRCEVTVVDLPTGQQPDQLSSIEIQRALTFGSGQK